MRESVGPLRDVASSWVGVHQAICENRVKATGTSDSSTGSNNSSGITILRFTLDKPVMVSKCTESLE